MSLAVCAIIGCLWIISLFRILVHIVLVIYDIFLCLLSAFVYRLFLKIYSYCFMMYSILWKLLTLVIRSYKMLFVMVSYIIYILVFFYWKKKRTTLRRCVFLVIIDNTKYIMFEKITNWCTKDFVAKQLNKIIYAKLIDVSSCERFLLTLHVLKCNRSSQIHYK